MIFTAALPKWFSQQHFQNKFTNGTFTITFTEAFKHFKMSFTVSLTKWLSQQHLQNEFHNAIAKILFTAVFFQNNHHNCILKMAFTVALPKWYSQQYFKNKFQRHWVCLFPNTCRFILYDLFRWYVHFQRRFYLWCRLFHCSYFIILFSIDRNDVAFNVLYILIFYLRHHDFHSCYSESVVWISDLCCWN